MMYSEKVLEADCQNPQFPIILFVGTEINMQVYFEEIFSAEQTEFSGMAESKEVWPENALRG